MSGYYSWDTNSDLLLVLELVSTTGQGVTGSNPLVAIKRIKDLSGSFLDGYYWNSASFVATPTFLSMSQTDSASFPGMYQYCFSQSLLKNEYVYTAYFKHEVDPIGFSSETHVFESQLSSSIKVYESEVEEG